MKLPGRFLVHSVTVRPLLGRSSTGPLFGAAFTLPCMAQGGARMVRDADGVERVSTLTLYAGLDVDVPPGSEVDWRGDTTTVMVSIRHDDGNLGAPQHTEVVCE